MLSLLVHYSLTLMLGGCYLATTKMVPNEYFIVLLCVGGGSGSIRLRNGCLSSTLSRYQLTIRMLPTYYQDVT